jgi:glycerol-3-phosphate dehydrogenase
MGEAVADGLYEAELEYLVKNEWASSSADILWRRSKLGLHLPADTAQRIDQWLAHKKEESRQLTTA